MLLNRPLRFDAAPQVQLVRQFNGSSDHLRIRTQEQLVHWLDGAGVISISAKVYLDPTWSAQGEVLWVSLSDGAPAKVAIQLSVLSGRTVRLGYRSAAADSFQSVTSATTLSTGQWYDVYSTVNFGTGAAAIYLDGSASADATASPTFSQSTLTASSSGDGYDLIGANGSDTGSIAAFFNGAICDLAIYKAALSSGEWAAIAGGGRPDQEASPVLYFPLDGETDLSGGGFANARIGGCEATPVGTSMTSTAPTRDAHAAQPTERKFKQTRAFRIRAADAAGVGDGNTVTAFPIRGAGVDAEIVDAPTYHSVGGKDVIRFDGSNDALQIDLGHIDLQQGFAVIALADVDSGFRMFSMSNATTAESEGFGFSPASGAVMASGTPDYSYSTFTDYTVGSSGLAVFSARWSGVQVANWLNGVRRNGTVTLATELSNGDFDPTHYPDAITTQKFQVGRRLHSTSSGYTDFDLYDAIFVVGAVTDEEIAYYEGILAHENGSESVLDVGHPWKSAQPTVTSSIAYPWGGDVIARSPDPRNKYVGTATIEAHDSKQYVAHDFFGDETDRTRLYRREGENDWRGVQEVEDLSWPVIWEHTDGVLYCLGVTRLYGDLVIKKLTSDGFAISSTTLSSGTGPVSAAGSGTTAPNYHTSGGIAPLYYDGYLFFAYQTMVTGVSYADGFSAAVLYIDATADLMDETNWASTSALAIGSTGYSDRSDGATPGFEEGNIVLDGSTLYNVLRFSGSDTPDKAVFLPLTWSSPTLSMPTWSSGYIKDFPGGNVQFQLKLEGSTYYAITNDNTAVADMVGSSGDEDQRNRVTLLSGTSLSTPNFTISQTVIDQDDVIAASGGSEGFSTVNHGFQYAGWNKDGSTIRAAYRIGWSGSVDRHDSNFIGYGEISV